MCITIRAGAKNGLNSYAPFIMVSELNLGHFVNNKLKTNLNGLFTKVIYNFRSKALIKPKQNLSLKFWTIYLASEYFLVT